MVLLGDSFADVQLFSGTESQKCAGVPIPFGITHNLCISISDRIQYYMDGYSLHPVSFYIPEHYIIGINIVHSLPTLHTRIIVHDLELEHKRHMASNYFRVRDAARDPAVLPALEGGLLACPLCPE